MSSSIHVFYGDAPAKAVSLADLQLEGADAEEVKEAIFRQMLTAIDHLETSKTPYGEITPSDVYWDGKTVVVRPPKSTDEREEKVPVACRSLSALDAHWPSSLIYDIFANHIGNGMLSAANVVHLLTLPVIGEGSVGAVQKTEHETAIKWSDNVKAAKYEAGILRKLKHPNIVKMISYEHTLCLIELELVTATLATAKEYNPEMALEGLLQATSYLESQKISHRDIDLGNTGIDGNGNIKLLDFGMAIAWSSIKKSTGASMGVAYAPPEILLLDRVTVEEVQGHDPWSVGTVALALFTEREFVETERGG